MTDFHIKKKEAGDPFESEEERDHELSIYYRTGLVGVLSFGATRERMCKSERARERERATRRYVSILRGKHPCATVSFVVALVVNAHSCWFLCVWCFRSFLYSTTPPSDSFDRTRKSHNTIALSSFFCVFFFFFLWTSSILVCCIVVVPKSLQPRISTTSW